MDSSRYKRRETKTGRQTFDEFTRGNQFTPRPLSATPRQPLAAATPPIPIVTSLQPASPVDIARAPQRLAAAPTQDQQFNSEVSETPEAEVSKARRLQRINMGLPGDPSPEKQAAVRVVYSKWQRIRRWGFRAVAVGLILVIAIGGVLGAQLYGKSRKVFKGGTASAAALKTNVDPSLLKGEGDGRINVLLLGRGGGTHDAPDLTDTLMLASIDPVNHTSTLLSLPRDLWVNVTGSGTMKINAVWETGKYKYLGKIDSSTANGQATLAGFSLIDQTVESVVGVPIHYNVLIDFEAFKQAIDTVGGVSLNVPEDLYDPTMAWENNNNPTLAKAGTQAFDGKHALIYVRSRETSSDFARAQRQRAVLLALKEKVTTLGTLSSPTKLSGLASAFGNNVQTDLSLSDAARMASIIKDVDNSKVKSIGLADAPNGYVTTGPMNGQSIVQPKAGLFNYGAIQTFVRGALKDPYLVKESANIQIYNGTTVPGLAGTQADLLKSYGYTITGTGNAPTKGYTQTAIVDLSGGKLKYTKHYLEQRYGVTAVTALPDVNIQSNGANFVIIVGTDATTTNQG